MNNRAVVFVTAHPILCAVAVWVVADLIIGYVIEQRRTAAVVAETRAQLQSQVPTLTPRMQYAVDGEHGAGLPEKNDSEAS